MITDATTWASLWRRLRRPRTAPAVDRQETGGVEIGTTVSGAPVIFPAPSSMAASHATVLSASGTGKSVLTAFLVCSELASQEEYSGALRPGYLILDPKGDLVDLILSGVAALAPHRISDIIYLEPFEMGFPFNLCRLTNSEPDIRAEQITTMVAQVSTARGSLKSLSLGARQTDDISHRLIAALTAGSRSNVLWALDSLIQKKGEQLLARATSSTRAQQYLRSRRKPSPELQASVSSRLRMAFAGTRQLEKLFASESCISFEEILAPGKLCILDLSKAPAGLMSQVELLANTVLREAANFLLARRSPWHGHHVRIVIDEAQVVASVLEDIAEAILTRGRSMGLSLITLSQGTVLLEDASKILLKVLFTNTPTKIIGRVGAQDAQRLAKEQAGKPGVDESVSSLRTRFSTAVCNLPDRLFYQMIPGGRQRFRSADVELERWSAEARIHKDELDAIKHKYALPEDSGPRLTLADAQPRRGPRQRSNSEPNPESRDRSPRRRPGKSRWG